ncbi:hypothetical protein HPP92_026688 [Vanilla planifolia]|uniref:Uncharacterized protein n=1 Tax=Vanilla planifolia TaxID=51239 RepID=A0A835U8Z0_VANPL|nr:hypothetical protein HPP92_026688 [Vanilla planifolia]
MGGYQNLTRQWNNSLQCYEKGALMKNSLMEEMDYEVQILLLVDDIGVQGGLRFIIKLAGKLKQENGWLAPAIQKSLSACLLRFSEHYGRTWIDHEREWTSP